MNGNKKLQEQIIEEYGKKYIRELEIPAHITDNLSKELRKYQEEALKLYLANNETIKANHLMFNMATGSGKTLIMAALMLDCYNRGYRNFIFFVNSTSILEKTKANFSDSKSSKYLFKDNILIDYKNVEINVIENLDESKDEAINIYFNTVQGLYSLLNNEKENSLTFKDLQDKKLVFLADEAHHLNSETKKAKLNIKDKELANSWENIITEAFKSHRDNLIFEFTATIPKDESVLEKYQDKIIYEYDLKHFCQEGYSKRIFLIKYESTDLKSKFLGAILLNLFREYVAKKNGIFLKPVVLFKSESVKNSIDNQKEFKKFIDNLNSDTIEKFYKNIETSNDSSSLINQSLIFFQKEFGISFYNYIAKLIKDTFSKNYILNANDNTDKQQLLLNSLEDKDNEIRVIFAVNKLNEGWDVLNLFDIVRLGNKKSSTTTTREVQLIGRGARLFPFRLPDLDLDMEFKRKFDNDLLNEMSILERLSYHTTNEVSYIKELEEEIIESGLLQEEPKKKVTLNITEYAKEIIKDNELYTIKNERKKGKDLPNIFNEKKLDDIKYCISKIDIPAFSKEIKEQEVDFNKETDNEELKGGENSYDNIKNLVNKQVFYKAINTLGFSFDKYIMPFGFKSRDEFFEYFSDIKLKFNKKHCKDRDYQLEIMKFILNSFMEQVKEIRASYVTTDFKVEPVKLEEKREIFTTKEFNNNHQYKWLYYDKYNINNAEEEFLKFIDKAKNDIDEKFSEWFIVRNDNFNEFKVYAANKNLNTNIKEVEGFEPDFIFFGKVKDKEDEGFLGIECFMEVKGEHLLDIDKWKEEFLGYLSGKYEIDKNINKALQIPCLKFFKYSKNKEQNIEYQKEFEKEFEKFLEYNGS